MTREPGSGPPDGLPRAIGGYRLLRKLGRSRLGPVLLARHRATGRYAALTVLKPEWACLPRFVSRLSRDAFTAAQIAHPNLVRLEQFGEAQGRLYLASEFVDGTPLAQRVTQQGAYASREALAFILQVARGLRFAHGQGLTHGDVRPENIVVDPVGVTKLAGLGLARTPRSVEAEAARETTGPIPPGDPRPAEVVAALQADIRGLGRALDQLLTGRPPDGDSRDTKATGLIARGIPANLVELIMSMAEARSGGGYTDLGQVVSALERCLNARDPGSTVPHAEHTRVLMESVRAFRASPAAKLRSRVVRGGVAACALLVLLTLLARQPILAGGFLGLGLMTALAYVVLTGLMHETDLFTKVRSLILGSRGRDWLIGLAGVILFVTALVALGLHWAWIALGTLGVILAAALHFDIDRRIETERHGSVEEAQAMLKNLRLQGVAEETLRSFVRATAGDDWEGLFEALFGYEAMRAARGPSDRGFQGILRKRSLPIRDGLTSWVEARLEVRWLEREQALLRVIEERRLVAEGVNLVTARRKARRIAEAMVAVALEIRAATRSQSSPPAAEVAGHPCIAQAIQEAAEMPEHVLVEREHGLIGPDRSYAWDLLVGPRTRFLLGAVLLAGCLLWVYQNGIVSGDKIKDLTVRAIEHPDPLGLLREARIDVRVPGPMKPLRLPFLPRPVSNLFRGFNPGVAGLILILSAMIGGTRVGLFATAGAAIALTVPAVGSFRLGPLDSQTAGMALGAGVALLGLFFGGARLPHRQT